MTNVCSSKVYPFFFQAIDGFLLILSSSGEVLYVSEGVADYVGVTQQEIIGLSIYELTHSDDHQSIRENLKAKGTVYSSGLLCMLYCISGLLIIIFFTYMSKCRNRKRIAS